MCETTHSNMKKIELLVCIYEISRELVCKYGTYACSRCLTPATIVNPAVNTAFIDTTLCGPHMSWAEVLSIIVLSKVSPYPGSKMMNKSFLIVDEQTVSRLNFPYYKKKQIMPENWLGMQKSNVRYADIKT